MDLVRLLALLAEQEARSSSYSSSSSLGMRGDTKSEVLSTFRKLTQISGEEYLSTDQSTLRNIYVYVDKYKVNADDEVRLASLRTTCYITDCCEKYSGWCLDDAEEFETLWNHPVVTPQEMRVILVIWRNCIAWQKPSIFTAKKIVNCVEKAYHNHDMGTLDIPWLYALIDSHYPNLYAEFKSRICIAWMINPRSSLPGIALGAAELNKLLSAQTIVTKTFGLWLLSGVSLDTRTSWRWMIVVEQLVKDIPTYCEQEISTIQEWLVASFRKLIASRSQDVTTSEVVSKIVGVAMLHNTFAQKQSAIACLNIALTLDPSNVAARSLQDRVTGKSQERERKEREDRERREREERERREAEKRRELERREMEKKEKERKERERRAKELELQEAKAKKEREELAKREIRERKEKELQELQERKKREEMKEKEIEDLKKRLAEAEARAKKEAEIAAREQKRIEERQLQEQLAALIRLQEREAQEKKEREEKERKEKEEKAKKEKEQREKAQRELEKLEQERREKEEKERRDKEEREKREREESLRREREDKLRQLEIEEANRHAREIENLRILAESKIAKEKANEECKRVGSSLSPLVPVEQMEARDQPGGKYLTKDLPLDHPCVATVQEKFDKAGVKFTISRAEYVRNEVISTRFFSEMQVEDSRLQFEQYKSNYEAFGNVEERNELMKQILTPGPDHPYLVEHPGRGKVALVYHGTDADRARHIALAGFSDMHKKTDAGWFGRGVYFTDSPAWASEYCKNRQHPCLVAAFLILREPFPVLSCDAPPLPVEPQNFRFFGKWGTEPHHVHVVPVRQYGDLDFRPPCKGEKAEAVEFVTRTESLVMAQIILHLETSQREFPQDVASWDLDMTAEWFTSLEGLTVAKDHARETILSEGIDAHVLLNMSNDEFKKLFKANFGDLRRIQVGVQNFLGKLEPPALTLSLPDPLEKWSQQDTFYWISKEVKLLKLGTEDLKATIEENGIGGDILKDFTEEEFEEALGLRAFGDRRKLTLALKALKAKK